MRWNNFCPSSAPGATPRTFFSISYSSAPPGVVRVALFKSSHQATGFCRNVRTTDFCAKLTVCSLSFTEDLFSLAGSSVFASQLLLDFLKCWVR